MRGLLAAFCLIASLCLALSYAPPSEGSGTDFHRGVIDCWARGPVQFEDDVTIAGDLTVDGAIIGSVTSTFTIPVNDNAGSTTLSGNGSAETNTGAGGTVVLTLPSAPFAWVRFSKGTIATVLIYVRSAVGWI